MFSSASPLMLVLSCIVLFVWNSSVNGASVTIRRDIGELVDPVVRHVDSASIYSEAEKAGVEKRKIGKVGLVWSNGEDGHLHQYVTSKTHYLYTWHPNCPKQAAQLGLNCARMLWGPGEVNQFRSVRTSSGTNILMGMNEVNEPSQSNMSPVAGIQLWNAEIRPFKSKGYKLVSPSVTSSPTGVTWFKKFFAGCGGKDKCGVDVLSVHYYGTKASSFESYVTQFHNTFGLTIWVTEFACQDFVGGPQCSKDGVWSFMSQVTKWMDQTSWIEAYFAFGLLHDMWNVNYLNQLMKADGSPTDLGYFYVNA